MDPINETGVTFGWRFERRDRAPFEGDLEILPKPRQDVAVRMINWPKALRAWVNRPGEVLGAMVRGDKIPAVVDVYDHHKFPGRYEPPTVVITVDKGSPGYLTLFEMRVRAFNAEYAAIDEPSHPDYRPRPFPKFDLAFMLGDRRHKLLGCFVLIMHDGETRSRVEIATDAYDDGSGAMRIIRSGDDDEAAEN